VVRALDSLGDKLPPEAYEILLTMSRMVPHLKAEDLVPESDRLVYLQGDGMINPNHADPKSGAHGQLAALQALYGGLLPIFRIDPETGAHEPYTGTIEELIARPDVDDFHLDESLLTESTGYDSDLVYRRKGFPQGAAISAFMSVLYLRNLNLPPGVHLTMYADDGLLSSDVPFDPALFELELLKLGLELSPSKCK